MNKRPIKIMHNQMSKRSLFKLIVKIGIGILLMVFAFSCARIPGLKEEVSGPVIKVPFVRVLIDDSQSKINIGSKGSFAVECLDDGHQNVVYANKSVKVDEVFITISLSLVDSKGNQISAAQVNETTFSDADIMNTVHKMVNKHANAIIAELFADICKGGK